MGIEQMLISGGVAVGSGLVMFLGLKYGPPAIGKILGSQLQKILDPKTDDPIKRQLIRDLALAAVKLAEYEIPDKGKGGERYALAAEWICRVLPFLRGQKDKLSKLIEGSVVAMDEELKKASQG